MQYPETKKAWRKQRKLNGLCVDCPNRTKDNYNLCQKCKERSNVKRLARHAKLKHEVFMAYGGYHCACPGCHEYRPNFLHIDHVNNDGATHRKAIGDRTGANMYMWLKRNSFPKGFQILCANCNWAKGRYGKCPHTNEQQPDNSLQCKLTMVGC